MRFQATRAVVAGIVAVILACILIIRLVPWDRRVTGPLRFRAVAHLPVSASPGKVNTDLYLKTDDRSVLLGFQDHSANSGFSINIEHPNPVLAKRLAEGVARNYQAQAVRNQSHIFLENGTNR